MRVVLVAGCAGAALCAVLAGAGDLRLHLALFLGVHLALVALMLVAWKAVARGGVAAYRVMVAAAVVMRLIAAAAPPSLSDDVYRYVWDGRVQAAGGHPYAFAPADPESRAFRDADVYPRINHPEIPTVYPPLAEMIFAALAAAHLGVAGFKAVFALLDVGVVLALASLLAALELPRHRVVLYAWNPLAIVEVAGSGHVEPLGVLLVLSALVAIVEGKAVRAGAALGGAIQAKLLPVVLLPALVRRTKPWSLLALLAVVGATTLPYGLLGPWFGGGVPAYARRWEHGSVLFAAFRRLFEWTDAAPRLKVAIAWAQARWGAGDTSMWDLLYASVWPAELARAAVVATMVAWAAAQSFRRELDAAHEARLVLGGALLLAPTLHPWYVLWVLPLAATGMAGGWLLLGALVPAQYLAGTGEVPWALRVAILAPPAAWMLRDSLLRFRR